MASQKDKDYHKLRHPEKYKELERNDSYGYRTKEGAEAYKRYLTIWSKYGQKSMVSDKRRRNSTRKSNQKDKQLLHQVERARFKSSLKNHLLDQDKPVAADRNKGYIITY